jgi:hypothetical protein
MSNPELLWMSYVEIQFHIFLSVAQQPNLGLGRLIVEVFLQHTQLDTHTV